MKDLKCKNCGKEISSEALFCPACGHPNKKVHCLSAAQQLLTLVVAIVFMVAVVIGLEMHFENKRLDIYKHIASDAVEQYNIIKQTGGHAKICLHARIVAASYLKANDEAKYQQWKEIGEIECKR